MRFYLNNLLFVSHCLGKQFKIMLHYLVRDIGVINEIECFIANAKPTTGTVNALSRMFPEITDRDQTFNTLSESVCEDPYVSFPHIVIVIMGYAGTGKSHILKHLANHDGVMLTAPTNAAGINLQNILSPSMLLSGTKKNVYRTIHSFYEANPEQTKFLGECVYTARRGNDAFASYDEYLKAMYEGCKPFCEILFAKEMKDGKLTPELYWEYRESYCKLQSFKHETEENIHNEVIRYLFSLGLESKIPTILLYHTSVVEEAGRCADYLTFLFLFYFYVMHVKYRTGIWKHIIPTLLFVGSPTQSRVIDKFTPYSALTYLSQPCMKRLIEEQKMIKIKCFKENRRMTMGNIEKNTILATVVSKLESRLSINEDLRNKFNSAFVTDESNFFDTFFKPSYFRIAKKHEDLKKFKNNVFKYNKHNTFRITEMLYCPLDYTSFTGLEGYINVKFRSENYDDDWTNIHKKTKLFDQLFYTYKTSRTLIAGFRYLLTEFHKLYIRSFTGTINQFLQVTDIFQQFIVSSKSSPNCITFFIDCGKYLIESIYSNQADSIVKGIDIIQSKTSDEARETSAQKLLALKAILQVKSSSSKIHIFVNEEKGTYITLPKDIFSFIITDFETRKNRVQVDEFTVIHLLSYDSLSLTLYPKLKSISTHEISQSISPDFPILPKDKKKKFYRNKRKRSDFENDDGDALCNGDDGEMPIYLSEESNVSFFSFVPLALHICCTIDCTQGLTIHSPIFALIRKEDRAEDIIVALTRTSNPDTLLVADRIFDRRYEPISNDTKNMIREINKTHRKDGWL